MLNPPGSGGAVNDAPPLDFVEFLAGERQLARDAAEHLLGSELRLFYTAPPEPFADRTTE
jgi:hypothetical protein